MELEFHAGGGGAVVDVRPGAMLNRIDMAALVEKRPSIPVCKDH
jgi:hypothetical protein